jgi:phosphoketolase
MRTELLSTELLHKMDGYWRAANYLSVVQIYLYNNPLRKEPLTKCHAKQESIRKKGKPCQRIHSHENNTAVRGITRE